MLFIKDPGSSSDFQIAPAGVTAARCYQVIDLGTQSFVVKGETKTPHQVVLGWELAELMEDGRPYVCTQKYTASLHEKANLRKMLEGWRGRAFTEAELSKFDLEFVLGKICMLNVIHVTGSGDRVHANVASVMPIPKGMASPKAHNETIKFSFDDFQLKEFETLPKYLQETIKKSPEWALHWGKKNEEGHFQSEELGEEDTPF